MTNTPHDSPQATRPLASGASAAGYSGVAIAFHWLLAAMMALSFSVGLYMSDLPISPLRRVLYNWHKWAGVTILALSALRLLWRLTHRPPANAAMPAWQRVVAHATNGLMYLLFFGVPLSGWALSSAAGFPIVWFGIWPLPDFVKPDPMLAVTLRQCHQWLVWCLVALVSLHLAAALKHQFIDRNGLLRRIWPRLRRAGASL